MIIETRAVQPFFKNGYRRRLRRDPGGVVIDPGDEVELLLEAVKRHRLPMRYILLTHAHLDHITGVGAREGSARRAGRPHQADNFLYRRPSCSRDRCSASRSSHSRPSISSTTAGPVSDSASTRRGCTTRPGHCPGGVCLAVGRATDDPETTLFVGDTLFAGSIGRTDLPGGDLDTLLRSIRDVLFSFPDDTSVYSGHGEPTTIGREKRTNPFSEIGLELRSDLPFEHHPRRRRGDRLLEDVARSIRARR